MPSTVEKTHPTEFISPLAGLPAPKEILVDVAKLEYTSVGYCGRR